MPVYKLNHDKCEDAVVNSKGLCQYYWWYRHVCYCSIPLIPVNLKYGCMLRCPYAHRHPNPNIVPGYEWTQDL